MKTPPELQEFVKRRIGRATFQKIVDYVTLKQPRLMGERVTAKKLPTIIALSLYKDLTGMGYQRVLSEVHLQWTYSHQSFLHNTKRLRALFHKWAQTIIKRGTHIDWKKAARGTRLPKGLSDITLWIDAVDFPVQKGYGRKQFWSHKLGSPGLQYMVIRDGKRQIHGLYGGYSPKTYEGTWLRTHKDLMEADWAGGVFVGDEHFHLAHKYFSDPVFHTTVKTLPTSEDNPNSQMDAEAYQRAILTKQQQAHNEQVSSARSRIESVCGQLSQTFQCLTIPWAEDFVQLDYVVNLAAAVANCKAT